MNREKIIERLQKEIKRSSEFPHIAYGIKTIYDFIRSVDDDTLLAIINEEVNTLISNGYNPKENNIINITIIVPKGPIVYQPRQTVDGSNKRCSCVRPSVCSFDV